MLHHTSPLAPTPTRSLLRGLAVGIAFTLMASMGWAQEAKIREMLPKQLPRYQQRHQDPHGRPLRSSLW